MSAADRRVLAAVSIVIPVAPGDEAWRGLLPDLIAACPATSEIILAGAEARPAGLPGARNVRWITARRGRARQLNAGAHAARGRWLWFLHADSRLDAGTIPALVRALSVREHEPPATDPVYFFDLAFLPDGPALMRLNALGAWVRSRVGRMPFGDQGLCVARAVFARIGGFDAGLPYGEDHVFVWRARQAGIAVRPVRARLWTSARRYQDNGWLRTTARHVRLTARQAWPEWMRLLRT